MSTPTLPRQPIKLSWAERYRPERLFYLLLVSLILSTPVNLFQALILQGPDSLSPSQWSQLYIVRMAVAYPLAAIAIGLLAIGLAVYGFRLDQRRVQKIADKEKQTRLEESRNQIQPVNEGIQQITVQNQQIDERTAEIHHLLTLQTMSTSSLIPVSDLKPATLNLGDDQSATFPYQSTIFPEVYTQATQIFRASIADPHRRGLLITGAPMAGKTRLAYQTMHTYATDWLTLTWAPGQTATDIPSHESLTNQHLILFLDDLQLYAESERGDEAAGTTNELSLDRLYMTLMQRASQVVIVATCRATDLSRAETTSSLRWLFEKVQVVEIPFLADQQKEEVIASLKQTNTTMDYHNDDFDGTVGSLLLGLSRKRDQYLELRSQRHPNHSCYLVLRAMKLLAVAGIPQHSKQRVRALAIQVLGGEMLSKDEIWNTTCETLEERQFLTYTDSALLIRKDVYFDKVITDYPKSDKLHDALLQARRVFQSEGDSEALLALGWTQNKRKEYQEMLETSTMTVELASSNARAHYAQGSAFMRLQRDEEALAAFEQSISLEPAFAVGWNNKGFILDNLKRYDEALTAYEEAIKLKADYSGAWYNKGITLVRLGRYSEALVAYDEAIKLNPHFANAWYNKGMALSNLHRFDEALMAYDEALAAATLDPTIATGWYNKGFMLKELKRYEEALVAYEEAIKLDERYTEAWYNKGIVLYNLEHYEEALICFDQALVIEPQQSVTWDYKGNVLYDLKRYEQALVCSDKALALDPQNAVAWNNKGYFLLELKRYEEALVCCNRAIAINAQHPNPWRHKGNALRGLHRYEEALVCFDQALAIDPQYAKAKYDKGAVLRELKRYEDALAMYDNALMLDPYNDQYYEEALAAFDEAIQMDPQNADAWYKKGKVLGKLKRNEEEKSAYETALQLNPQYKYAGGWSTPGFGRYLSPDLVDDEFLDAEIVILLHGTNVTGDQIYSYTKVLGSGLKAMFAKMQAGEYFKPDDFGTVLEAGFGVPPQEIRDKMKEEWNMIDVPMPVVGPTIQSKFFDDEIV
jgi:tetratricopeptide (TPR) repeat protein